MLPLQSTIYDILSTIDCLYDPVEQTSVFAGGRPFAGASCADSYCVAEEKIKFERIVGRKCL